MTEQEFIEEFSMLAGVLSQDVLRLFKDGSKWAAVNDRDSLMRKVIMESTLRGILLNMCLFIVKVKELQQSVEAKCSTEKETNP